MKDTCPANVYNVYTVYGSRIITITKSYSQPCTHVKTHWKPKKRCEKLLMGFAHDEMKGIRCTAIRIPKIIYRISGKLGVLDLQRFATEERVQDETKSRGTLWNQPWRWGPVKSRNKIQVSYRNITHVIYSDILYIYIYISIYNDIY